MRTILILNAKGGCGKSTIATNLASYFATKSKSVALMDFDTQGSSLDWLKERPRNRSPIQGIAGWKGNAPIPRKTEILILDVPANIHGKELNELLRKAETALIPVLPSPIDMRAASHYITELSKNNKVGSRKIKLGVIANRFKDYTRIAHTLDDYLKKLKIPVVAHLRDSQNYIRAAERGLGVFEMAPYLVKPDLEQWAPLVKWLNSKRSMP